MLKTVIKKEENEIDFCSVILTTDEDMREISLNDVKLIMESLKSRITKYEEELKKTYSSTYIFARKNVYKNRLDVVKGLLDLYQFLEGNDFKISPQLARDRLKKIKDSIFFSFPKAYLPFGNSRLQGSIKEAISELEKIAGYELEINSLKKDNQLLKDENQKLKFDYGNVLNKYKLAKTELFDQKQEVKQLKKENSELRIEVKQLTSKVTNLEEKDNKTQEMLQEILLKLKDKELKEQENNKPSSFKTGSFFNNN